ncbi:hypothetical protein GCM10023187_54110 [Nibrella viscosa]|uniref:Uncharacterized protein n=1 Tax=Nibrella viscosa TaxID=1084524 RepID=A0ABP8L047_9BACT
MEEQRFRKRASGWAETGCGNRQYDSKFGGGSDLGQYPPGNTMLFNDHTVTHAERSAERSVRFHIPEGKGQVHALPGG